MPLRLAYFLIAACLLRAIPAGAQSATLSTAQVRTDVSWFRQNVFQVDRSYTASARAEADRRLARLDSTADGMSVVAFQVEIARIVALADNGHSNAFAAMRARVSNHVPIRLATFGDELRVLRATAPHGDLLGARLVAIDGNAVGVARDSVRTMFGGTAAWRDRSAPFALESPEQLKALGIAREAQAAVYEFELLNGKRVERRLQGGSWEGMTGPDQLLYPETNAAVTEGWVAFKPASVPWSLGEPHLTFRWRTAPEADGIVIQLRRIVDGPGQAIVPFLAEMTDTIRATRPRNLVIDLRLNGGGNLGNTRDFVKALPALVPGRIYVLTGPATFSAAISTVGYLKQAAPDRVIIVGEEVGDRLVFFAEGRPVVSPNSGMMIGIATQRHDYQNGCRAFTDCHGPVVRYPIAVPTLAPDITAPLGFAEWKGGVDPAMAAVAKAVKAKRPPA